MNLKLPFLHQYSYTWRRWILPRKTGTPVILFFLMPALFAMIYSGILALNYATANFGSDGGDFLAAALSNGIPHPSCYPLYIFLLKYIEFLPINSPYLKGSLLSFLPFLISIGLISILPFWVIKSNFKASIASILSSFIFATAPLVVSQAVIVEVYGLQTLFVVLHLIWMAAIIRNPENPIQPAIFIFLAFLCGLSLSNHLTSIFLIPIYLSGLFLSLKSGFSKTVITFSLIFYLSGSLFYLYLPWLASAYPPVNWGNPQTLRDFFWLVSGRMYQTNLNFLSPSLLWERGKALAGLFLENATLPGLYLGIFCAFQFTNNRYFNKVLVYLFFVSCIFSVFYASNDSMVYLIPAVVVYSIWIGLSIDQVWDQNYKKLPWGKILVVLTIILAILRIPLVRKQVDPTQNMEASLFAENLFKSAPPGAIILTSTDEDTFPLWYYHFGLKQRNDIKLISLGLYDYPWYRQTLTNVMPGLSLIPSEDHLFDQVWMQKLSLNNQNAPICRTWPEVAPSLELKYACYFTP